MKTAVDPNVLLDVFLPDAVHQEQSVAALARAASDGGLIVSEVVGAELGAHFPTLEAMRRVLEQVTLQLVPSDLATSHLAGQAFRAYCKRGGRRERVIAEAPTRPCRRTRCSPAIAATTRPTFRGLA